MLRFRQKGSSSFAVRVRLGGVRTQGFEGRLSFRILWLRAVRLSNIDFGSLGAGLAGSRA